MGSLERASTTAAVTRAKQPARCLAGSSLSNRDPHLHKFWADMHENPSPEHGVNKNAWLCTRQPFAWWGCSDLLVRRAHRGGTVGLTLLRNKFQKSPPIDLSGVSFPAALNSRKFLSLWVQPQAKKWLKAK